MKTIQINSKEIVLPTNWADVKLGDYEQWAVHNISTDDEYLACVANICNLTMQDLSEIPSNILTEIKDSLQFIFEDYEEQSITATINDSTFGITSKKDLIVAEWLHLEEINENDNPLYSRILAAVCRPIGEKFDEDKLEERALLFKGQPCNAIFPLINSFLKEGRQAREMLKITLETIGDSNNFLTALKEFEEHGDGIKYLSFLQRKKYNSLVKSLEKQLAQIGV